jgi:hypothetical protein
LDYGDNVGSGFELADPIIRRHEPLPAGKAIKLTNSEYLTRFWEAIGQGDRDMAIEGPLGSGNTEDYPEVVQVSRVLFAVPREWIPARMKVVLGPISEIQDPLDPFQVLLRHLDLFSTAWNFKGNSSVSFFS